MQGSQMVQVKTIFKDSIMVHEKTILTPKMAFKLNAETTLVMGGNGGSATVYSDGENFLIDKSWDDQGSMPYQSDEWERLGELHTRSHN